MKNILKKEKGSFKKGFSLIEIMIAISIIGIIAGVVMVSLNSARESARRVSALSSVSSVMKELALCANDNGDAVSSAPTGGTTPVCCTDPDDCTEQFSGFDSVWPDISDTGWSYDAGSFSGTLFDEDYAFTISNSGGDVITCNLAQNNCQ